MVVLLSVLASSTQLAKGQEERLRVNLERVEYWQSKGAQVSDRVAKLVKEAAKAAE